MFTARSLMEAGFNALKISSKRYLSASRVFASRPLLRPAPQKPQTNFSQDLPFLHLPMSLLQSAKQSGVLDIESHKSSEILNRYVLVARQRKKIGTWEKQFCKDEKITPTTLLSLGLMVLKLDKEEQRKVGLTLLFSASAMGEASATIYLLNNALKGAVVNSPDYAAPLSRLRTLAAPPHSNIEAMVLLGKIHDAKGDKATAFSLFKRAASTPPDASAASNDDSPTPHSATAAALVHLGAAFESRGDSTAAHATFKRAALTHDDPTAYYRLGMLQTPLSPLQEEYFLKAAASGNVDAAKALAELYRLKASRYSSLDGRPGDQHMHTKLAREWALLSV